MMKATVLSVILLATLSLARAEGQESQSANDRFTSLNLPPEFSGNLGNLLLNFGGFILTVLVLSGLVVLLLPLFGWKTCALLGNCDQSHSYDHYTYNQPGGYSGSSYNKRSMEYFQPIMKTLLSAYEKYSTKKEEAKL